MHMAKHRRFFAPLIVLLGILLAANTALAKSPAHQYADEIAQAEELGKIIYEKDIAAWVGTDKMLAELGNDVSGLPIRGWVTDKDGKRYRVNFIGEQGGEFKVYYQAWTKGKKVKKTKTYEQGIALTSQQMTMWKARQLASKQEFEKCAKTYNTVVVPYEHAGVSKLYVYLFASTTDPSKVVLGGHHRFLISSDGMKVENHIEFSNSCIALDKQSVPDGSSVAGLLITHLKTNYPQEHHVFGALTHGLSLYVSIAKTRDVYEVKNGKIKLIKAQK